MNYEMVISMLRIEFIKRDLPYLIPTMDRGPVIVLPTEQMKVLEKLPDDQLDVFSTLQEQIQARYTIRDQRVVLDPYHRYLIPSQLTRKLDTLTGPMLTELEDAFKSSWGTDSKWTEVTIWKACFHVVARAANSALCGSPLCSDEKYLASLEGQSVALFGGAMLINITPKLLRPVMGYLVKLWCAYYARKFTKICAPYVEARIRETIHSKFQVGNGNKSEKDALQLIIDEAISRDDDTQLSVQLISDRLLITNNVSLHGTTSTLHNLISSLVTSDPSLGYIEALRQECDKALSDAGGTWNSEAIRKLKLVDSAIRDSMRVAPFASIAMARAVVDPSGISIENGKSRVLVPQGTILALPMESIHCDETIYPDARQFDPFRFVKTKSEGSDSTSDGLRYETIKPTTTPDDHFFGFGTSKNPCPGRFLAVHEIKLIVAYLLTNYDIEYTEARPQLTDLLAMKIPDMKTVIRVRKRCI
ncbi:cytochrome P450 [Annulohypoxylon maeteangense]|uniref:cytochrome P450 n=1 Tax=Annulohypoxylon maeteangense TaxID=1927788 RepID=UPI0020086616|nr:cytochrome P450 [Annulohypoxylon maeteangense]KAI0884969.1 cytochrome P450 [Annulohypoxylon maeteangense]